MRRAPAVLAALSAALLALAAEAAGPAATSADGRWRLLADGNVLTVIDNAGRPLRSHVAAAADGSNRSAVTEIHDAAPRRSFVVVFATLPEIWEISYDRDAEPIYQGLVHDYRLREGIAEAGFLNPRRTRLDAPLRDAGFDSSHAFVIARAPAGSDGQAVLHLVQLDVRRRIAEFSHAGDPDSAGLRRVQLGGREILELPDRRGGPPLRIEPRSASVLAPQPP